MNYGTLLVLRDELHIGDISQAFRKIHFRGPLKLNDEWLIRYENKVGGFHAVNTRDPLVWWPICPCRGSFRFSS